MFLMFLQSESLNTVHVQARKNLEESSPLAGTKLCRFFASGQPCRYGSKCTHSHGEDGVLTSASQAFDFSNKLWWILPCRMFQFLNMIQYSRLKPWLVFWATMNLPHMHRLRTTTTGLLRLSHVSSSATCRHRKKWKILLHAMFTSPTWCRWSMTRWRRTAEDCGTQTELASSSRVCMLSWAFADSTKALSLAELSDCEYSNRKA